ncbi:MAG: hypothetical protein SFV15_18940 [Polyangiaceae bacterium]|nr:hypothetical protein [Polyangiaceae bacterium]
MLPWRRFLVLATLACAGACGKSAEEPAGQLMLTLETDMSIPKDIDSVRIEIRSSGAIQFSNDFELGPGALKLPATLALAVGKDPSLPVNIRVVAFQKSVPRVLKEIITTVPADRVATLPVRLHWLCADARSVKTSVQGEVQSACPADQSCSAGACTSAGVNSANLESYSEQAIFGGGTAAGEGQCFDLAGCFTTTFPLTPMAGCRLPIPQGQDTSQINFGLRSAPGGAGLCNQNGCVVPLDFGTNDGWRVDGADVVFPKAVCDVTSLGVTLVAAMGCPSKLSSMPSCGAGTSVSGQIVGVPSPTGGAIPTTQPTTPPTNTTQPTNPPANQEQILASGFVALDSIAVNKHGVFWMGERGGQSGIFRCGVAGCGMNPVTVFSGTGKVLAMELTSEAVVFSHQGPQGNGSQLLSCPLPDGCVANVTPKVIATTPEAIRVMASGDTDVYWHEATKFLSCAISRDCGAAAAPFADEPQLVGDMEFSEGRVFWAEPMAGEIRYCEGPTCIGGPQAFATAQSLPGHLAIAGGHAYWLNGTQQVKDCPLANCGGGMGLTIYDHELITAIAADSVDVFAADRPRPSTFEIVQIIRTQPPSPPVQAWSGPSATVDMALDLTAIYFTSEDGNVRRVNRPIAMAGPAVAPTPVP